MTDIVSAARRIIDAYNAKDFDYLESALAPDLAFSHFNRNYTLDTRTEFLALLRTGAYETFPGRRYSPAECVTADNGVVVRESWWRGDFEADLPGIAVAGDVLSMKLCTVFQFDADGLLIRWSDYG